MELFQVICAWDGDDLTVWESTQHVVGTQHGIARQLGIPPERIRVIAPFVGGGFGSRNMPPHDAAWLRSRRARSAARSAWCVTRQQGFTLAHLPRRDAPSACGLPPTATAASGAASTRAGS